MENNRRLIVKISRYFFFISSLSPPPECFPLLIIFKIRMNILHVQEKTIKFSFLLSWTIIVHQTKIGKRELFTFFFLPSWSQILFFCFVLSRDLKKKNNPETNEEAAAAAAKRFSKLFLVIFFLFTTTRNKIR